MRNLCKNILIGVLTAFCLSVRAANYTVDGSTNSEPGHLTYETIPVSIAQLNNGADHVLFTFQSISSNISVTNITLELAGSGIGPGNIAILSGATIVSGTGAAPASTTFGLAYGYASNTFSSVTYHFDPPLAYGQQSVSLDLEYPLGFVAEWVSNGASIEADINKGGYGTLGLQSSIMPSPTVSIRVKNNQAVISWTGYTLQGSTNLSTWENLYHNTIIGGVNTYLPVTNGPRMFFRAVN